MKTIIFISLLSLSACALETDLWGPNISDKTFTNAIRKIEDNFTQHESDISTAQNNINNLADNVSDNSQAIDILSDDVNDNFQAIEVLSDDVYLNEQAINELPTRSENDTRYIRENIPGDVTTDNIATGNVTSQKLHSAVWAQINVSGGGLTEAEADNRYVELTGDTMTGDLDIKYNKILFGDGGVDYTEIENQKISFKNYYNNGSPAIIESRGGIIGMGNRWNDLFINMPSGDIVMQARDNVFIYNIASPTNDYMPANKSYVDTADTANRNELLATNNAMKVYVDSADNLKLNLSGGTMTGNLNMNFKDITSIGNLNNIFTIGSIGSIDAINSDINLLSHKLTSLAPGTAPADSINLSQLTSATNTCLQKSGDTMSGTLNMANNDINNINNINTIVNINDINNIDSIDSIEGIGSVNDIGDLTYIDYISEIGEIEYISTIGDIGDINSIEYISELEDIDSVSYINYLNEIGEISEISNIDMIGDINNINSIDTIDIVNSINSDISLLSHKLTSLAPGTAQTDSINLSQLTSATNYCLQSNAGINSSFTNVFNGNTTIFIIKNGQIIQQF